MLVGVKCGHKLTGLVKKTHKLGQLRSDGLVLAGQVCLELLLVALHGFESGVCIGELCFEGLRLCGGTVSLLALCLVVSSLCFQSYSNDAEYSDAVSAAAAAAAAAAVEAKGKGSNSSSGSGSGETAGAERTLLQIAELLYLRLDLRHQLRLLGAQRLG